jgi:hypothetical protein
MIYERIKLAEKINSQFFLFAQNCCRTKSNRKSVQNKLVKAKMLLMEFEELDPRFLRRLTIGLALWENLGDYCLLDSKILKAVSLLSLEKGNYFGDDLECHGKFIKIF